jgi:hypothetical protein
VGLKTSGWCAKHGKIEKVTGSRDDKKGRVVERKGQSLKERAVIDEKGVPPHIRSPLAHPIL